MNTNLNEQTYQTSDLALATCLCLFFPLEGIDRTNARRVTFIFEKSEDLDTLVNQYWRGQVQVEPQKFFNQLKIIKSRLYGEQ
ncbi:MAG: DUF5659 domain-containing protein [Candidatus Omnitrophota bacterium]